MPHNKHLQLKIFLQDLSYFLHEGLLLELIIPNQRTMQLFSRSSFFDGALPITNKIFIK